MGRRSLIFSIADQLASAMSLFLFAAIVSRALPKEVFGELSVMLAWVSLIGALLQPALIDSSTVLASRDKQDEPDWGRMAIHLSLCMQLLVVLASLLVFGISAPEWVLVITLALASEVVVSAMVLLRRTSYVRGPVWMGSVLSLGSMVLTAIFLPPLVQGSETGVEDALLGRVLVNALVAVPTCWLLVRTMPSSSLRHLTRGASQLVAFSRPYIGGSAIFWVTNSLQVVLIGHALSMSDAAGYRAAQLLVLPVSHLQAAIFQLMLPKTIRQAHGTGFSWRQAGFRLGLMFGLPALCYITLLVYLAGPLLGLVFGPAYVVFVPIVMMMSVFAFLEAIKQAVVILIYALDRKELFLRYRLWALVLFIIGVAPALWFGQLLIFVAISAAISFVLLMYLILALNRRTEVGARA